MIFNLLPRHVVIKKKKSRFRVQSVSEKWSLSYFFTKMNKKPVCLICLLQIGVLKEYNLCRHYTSLHANKYEQFQGLQRKEKLDKLLQCLKNQQSVFTHSRNISHSAVKASYLIAYEMAMSSKPFIEGEFIKTCMLKAAEVVFPENQQAFEKTLSDKKLNRRQDFRSLSKFKQPIKKQHKKIYCLFSFD